MGIGAVVRAYPSDKAGEAEALIQRRDIVIGTGYSSSEEALAHLGLGDNQTVDIVIRWGDETRTLHQVKTNQYLTVNWNESE
jgi:DNA-binding IclR family transcriptional regulator